MLHALLCGGQAAHAALLFTRFSRPRHQTIRQSLLIKRSRLLCGLYLNFGQLGSFTAEFWHFGQESFCQFSANFGPFKQTT